MKAGRASDRVRTGLPGGFVHCGVAGSPGWLTGSCGRCLGESCTAAKYSNAVATH
jgi:hypothetical protein